MPGLYNRPISDDEFRQHVRRYAPSRLLPIVAAISARYSTPEEWMHSPYKKFTPWALAEVARTSLAYGNEFRQELPDENSVLRSCAAYVAITDPELASGKDADAFWNFMSRMSHEQLTHQLPVYGELARSIAIFQQTSTVRDLQVLSSDWSNRLFNCSVSEYVATAFLLHVGSLNNAGVFDLSWLEQSNFAPIIAELAKETFSSIVHAEYTTDVRGFKSSNSTVTAPQIRNFRRHSFNPLQAKPVIEGLERRLIIPSQAMLVRKASPLGIYHAGVVKWGQGFTNEVGYLFEVYVGRHLQLMQGAVIHCAITYGRDKRESVDWFAVFDDVVILVEVKASRSTESIRTAGPEAGIDLATRLGKAVRQIGKSAKLVLDCHESFNDIPRDRPLVGLIVTMEPFHTVNAAWYRKQFDSIAVPYLICSSSELEQIVTCTSDSVGSLLLRYAGDSSKDGWSVRSAFEGQAFADNPVLGEAWATLPWKEDVDPEH